MVKDLICICWEVRLWLVVVSCTRVAVSFVDPCSEVIVEPVVDLYCVFFEFFVVVMG
jgi:hypothetical protein